MGILTEAYGTGQEAIHMNSPHISLIKAQSYNPTQAREAGKYGFSMDSRNTYHGFLSIILSSKYSDTNIL